MGTRKGPRKVRAIGGSLLKKGFILLKDRDHHVFQLCVDGEKVGVRTRYSHGADEYGDGILKRMADQLMLTKPQLYALIDCQMSGEDYVRILRELGEL
jgi:hypothetical protein